jgi:hypothetical protein
MDTKESNYEIIQIMSQTFISSRSIERIFKMENQQHAEESWKIKFVSASNGKVFPGTREWYRMNQFDEAAKEMIREFATNSL